METASGYPRREGKRGRSTEVGESHWPQVQKAEPHFSSQAGGRAASGLSSSGESRAWAIVLRGPLTLSQLLA